MKNNIYFDREKFTNDVIEVLNQKKAEELDEDSIEDIFGVIFAGVNEDEDEEKIEKRTKAKELFERQDIRHLICPFLESCTNDVFEVAKILIPLLTAAIFSGKISFPIDVEVSAAFFFLVAKAGISGYCKKSD